MAVGYIKRLAGPFSGAGTKTLPFGFKIFAPTDVYVALAAAENEPPATLVYGSDYTVTKNDDQDVTPGGTVELATPLTAEQRVSVGSKLPYTQEVQLTNHNRFPPEIVNTGLDRVVIQIQQVAEIQDRAIKTYTTDSRTPEQLLSDIFNTEKNAGASAAAAAKSASEAKTSAGTAKKYSDAVTSFKEQIVATGNNIAAVKTNADNIEDIKTAAKNVAAIKTNANNIGSIKINATNMDAIRGVRAQLDNILAVAGHLSDIHAIGTEVRQDQASAKKSAEAAAASEAAAKVSQDNAFAYRGEAAVARNEAQKIAEGVTALDGSGVAQATLDLMKHLGASEVDTDEYLRAFVDAEGRLLWWVDHNGNIGWSKGIPEPIQKVLTALQDLTAGHTDSIVDLDNRLSTTIDESNSEYLRAFVDAEGRLLWGIKSDGSIENTKGIPTPTAEAIAKVDAKAEKNAADITDANDRLSTTKKDNPEWLKVWQDKEGKILAGIRTDGTFEFFKGIPVPVQVALNALMAALTTNAEGVAKLEDKTVDLDNRLATEIDEDNPEWLRVVKDADGKVLYGVKTNGSVEFSKMPSPVKESLADVSGRLTTTVEENSPEWLKVWQDEDGKVLAGIRTDGTFNVSKPGWPIAKATTDWSDASSIQIPEPRCAVVNVISSYNAMPTTKTDDHKDWLEFWDMRGNYFKKRIINNAQGASSLGYPKKNFAIDLCNDEWQGDNTFSIRFGNWVPQDSFHIKAYYREYFRGRAVTCYQLMNEVCLTRGIDKDRPWKKGLKVADGWGVIPKSFAAGGDNSLALDDGARCFPDGFPVIVYLNGEFYGIFSWQLKKSRQNMHMGKKTAEHIHLDGIMNVNTLINYTGNPDFNIQWDQFEIRNPKSLYCMDGSKYESDVNQQELIDETSEHYKASNKDHVRSAKVKKYIQNFSLAMHKIRQVRETEYLNNPSAEGAAKVRAEFEKYFDPENYIDYLCVSDMIYNVDGFWHNCQWATYDGVKWFVNMYDVDVSFGEWITGDEYREPLTSHISDTRALPSGFITDFYSVKGKFGTGELEARYAELRKKGIFTVDHIVGLLSEWVSRIGVENYDKEYEKWPNCKCHGENVVDTPYWKLVLDENGNPKTAEANDYDDTKTYAAGETCGYGASAAMGYYTFEALTEVTGRKPIQDFRYYDSIYRVKAWLTKNLSNMDKLYRYSEE